MGLKSTNLLIGKVLPPKKEDAPKKISVGEKLRLKINKSKAIEQNPVDTLLKPVEEVKPTKTEFVREVLIKIKDPAAVPLLMKDQVIRSSKYLQDLTYEEK